VDGHFPAAGVVRFPPQKPDDLMKLSPLLALVALLALAFTLATGLASRADRWSRRDQSGNLFGMLFGDGRKLFANQFFTMADVYFHSGYYPSVFDQKSAAEKEIISASHGKKETEDDEKNEDFLGKPKDWIDAFGRHFRITQHTHLENHTEREILPWLRLAADLDPQKIETFTVGAFFLREHLNRPDQAEAFLREGLRNNPANCEILFELGRIYHESNHDRARARNVWELGVKKFLALTPEQMKDDKLIFEELVVNLAHLEEEAGNYGPAINWLHAAQTVSPNPAGLQTQIDDLQKKLTAQVPVVPAKLY
jgi:tetratricopeptide (TPR) repeat protein